jgi:hypothetical protein
MDLKRNRMEDTGADENTLIKCILKETGWEALDKLYLAHVKDKWSAVNTATKFS